MSFCWTNPPGISLPCPALSSGRSCPASAAPRLSVSHDRLYLEEVCQTIYALTPQGLERVWHK